MSRSRRRRPLVEPLEAKALLSNSSALKYLGPVGSIIRNANAPTSLNGVIRGTITDAPADPGDGHTVTLSGTGRIEDMGRVRIEGSIRGTDPGSADRPDGRLVLTSPRGSVTLILRGRNQDGSAPLPDHYRYDVIGGRGVFWRAKGSGIVVVRPGATLVTHVRPNGNLSRGSVTIGIQTDPDS
jgi:hypothetical protein